MVRAFFARVLVGFLLITAAPAPLTAAQLAQFPTEQQAQQHCPDDYIVWLNLPSGIYHYKGQRWYGATKNGAFVCKAEADAAGDRASRNGQ
ncbi:hypothetical protein GCM10011611_02700 [Aliidongia dinghuensis]|uniref:Uncharacterized protein n=1 Tax=Aliidongia dinghuensis TaxID=1867774 RepID=A0A8J3E0C4_9PROT|nr:hypothetical protein [Aliidongia dinghuensis]GGF00567.1 hypothetical protein GCM10011611_02700 [Aliidongia dinghuensis]